MTNPDRYRAGLPTIPQRLLNRPVERGYPVPWFCDQVDGKWDFRIADARKFRPAIQLKLCWICGQALGGYKAFMIGPMCAINRVISEPPSHRECAEWAVRACPFLNQQEVKRNATQLPGGLAEPVGIGIMHQPGVMLLWITKSYKPFRVDDGLLFSIGEPIETHWYREGRPATRAEVLQAIDKGYPILLASAESEGPAAVRELEAARDRALTLVPGGDQ
jgi:hypothetical protein